MDKYILRYLILGQLIFVGLFAWSGTPSNDATYVEAIMKTVGLLAALDITGLTFAYVAARRDEFKSFVEFIKAVW